MLRNLLAHRLCLLREYHRHTSGFYQQPRLQLMRHEKSWRRRQVGCHAVATLSSSTHQQFCETSKQPISAAMEPKGRFLTLAGCCMLGLSLNRVVSGLQAGRELIDNTTEWLVTEYGASCTQGIGDWSADHGYHDMIDQVHISCIYNCSRPLHENRGPHRPRHQHNGCWRACLARCS